MSALEAGTSKPKKPPIQPKCSAAAAVLLEERREFAGRRAAAIAANAGLHERELLKLAALAAASAGALRNRGLDEPAATLAAEVGVTVFKGGVERWLAAGASGRLAQSIHETSDELRTMLTPLPDA
ncbi:hypothetical protein [Cryptosporangium minutisporangium]|uniref:MftR C-terminal domain-containing protein n=1 Tax=Cryptosporangium minutisporangium TaxID=113569 RepID=A0ABP6T2Y4_9ACTN